MKSSRLLISLLILLFLYSVPGSIVGNAAQQKSSESQTGPEIEELTVYAMLPYFKWEETVKNAAFVKESGMQYGGGIMLRAKLNKTLLAQLKLELSGGDVDYDGTAQYDDGSTSPLVSTTGYFGAKMEFDLGRRISLKKSISIEPFFGLGYRWWQRDIHDSIDAMGNPIQGYIEEWNSLYGQFGVRADYSFRHRTKLYLELGGKAPLNNNNRISTSSGYLLKPGKEASMFGEIGTHIGRLRMGFHYEGLRFSDSPIVVDTMQPKSICDLFGLKIGWDLH